MLDIPIIWANPALKRLASAVRFRPSHITGGLVNKQWVRARRKAGLPENLVLYCARHNFGTYVLQKTGDLAVVMNSMGHSDVKRR